MEINSKLRKRKKFVSSFANILLVLGVFVVLFPLSTPPAKADTLWYDNWDILSWQEITRTDDTIIINGSLNIYGKLTLDNCTIQMRYKPPDDPDGDLIHVHKDGTFNVTNNSLITIYDSYLDRYEFKIEGTALIENSTVEEMKDFYTKEADGIQIYSNDVEIKNSTIQDNWGNGIYVKTENLSITNSKIQTNLRNGVYLDSSSKINLTNNYVYNNGKSGIYLHSSSGNNITDSIIGRNNVANLLLESSSNNNITNNTFAPFSISYISEYGIHMKDSSNNSIINNNFTDEGVFIEGNSLQHFNTHTIPDTNKINGKPLYYYKNCNNFNIDGIPVGEVILANCSNVNITNLLINNSDVGIEIAYSTDILIANNNITNFYGDLLQWYGIYLYSSSKNNITSNNVSNFYTSISLLSSPNNNITGNNITNNICGISLWSSSNNNITDNNVSIYPDGRVGIELVSSSNINITGNDIASYFCWYGISLEWSSNNNIIDNNISSSGVVADPFPSGIYLFSSNYNKIGMNSVVTNYIGIRLIDSSNSNLITSNHLANNTNYALYMSSSNENEIIDNDLQYSNYGAFLTSSNNNILYHNNLKNNTINNATDDRTNQWDNGLEGNWWGDMGDYTDSDGDGICDSNYTGYNFVDNLPLANEDNDRVLVDDPWFWFIQSGVNFAEPGWTVYATSSTYLENVTIDKTLTVIGEDRNSTIINARGEQKVVLIESTSNVNVSGFTVQNATYGIYLNNSNYCFLKSNNITNNYDGVNITNSSNITIENNTVSFNEFGIRPLLSNSTKISYCDIYNNTGGVYVTSCSNITIEYSNITKNDGGFRIYNSSSTIRYNNISYNLEGIADVEYSNATIGNNTITHNNIAGIKNMFYSNGTIDNNTISYNNNGIECIEYSSPIITFNNITFNTNGIMCQNSSNPVVHWNNIHNNTIYNMNNTDLIITINAEKNYWGSDPPSGISGLVDYNPYETTPIEEAGPG